MLLTKTRGRRQDGQRGGEAALPVHAGPTAGVGLVLEARDSGWCLTWCWTETCAVGNIIFMQSQIYITIIQYVYINYVNMYIYAPLYEERISTSTSPTSPYEMRDHKTSVGDPGEALPPSLPHARTHARTHARLLPIPSQFSILEPDLWYPLR